MASGATKSHIFQQLFSIKKKTKLSYWVYIFLGNFLKYCSNAKKAVFAEVGAVHPYQICKKNEKIRLGSHHNSRKSVFLVRNSLSSTAAQPHTPHVKVLATVLPSYSYCCLHACAGRCSGGHVPLSQPEKNKRNKSERDKS